MSLSDRNCFITLFVLVIVKSFNHLNCNLFNGPNSPNGKLHIPKNAIKNIEKQSCEFSSVGRNIA